MIKRSTWIVLVILALVIGSYFLIKNRPEKTSDITPTPTGILFLITDADGLLQDFRIAGSGNTFEMERGASKTWNILLPEPGPADQGLAEAAETQVSALRIVARLEAPPALGDMGLDKPAYTIKLSFDSGITYILEIGDLTPTGSGYYVQVDNQSIYIISDTGIDPLLNLLTAPPYPATATPTLEPTATETPMETPALETETPTP